jgi:hypothetical protein
MNRAVTTGAALALLFVTVTRADEPSKSNKPGSTSTTITQSESSADGSSRRQTTITRSRSSSRSSSSGNQSANGKNARFKVGDKVLVEWGGEMQPAQVIGIKPTGWIEVKFKRNGRFITPVFPPEDVKLAGKSTAKKAPAKSDSPLRTWTSKNGKFKIQAKFVRLEDDQLTLEKEGGDTVTVALEKLSEADQKAAREFAENSEEDPFESGGDNPFQPDAEQSSATEWEESEPSEGDWSEVEQLVIEAPATWSLAPDAAPAPSKPLAAKPIVLMSPALKKGNAEAFGFFEKVEGLIFNRSTSEAIVPTFDNNPGGEHSVRVQRVDLVAGKSGPPMVVAAMVKPVDLDLSGKRMLARSDFFVSGQITPEVTVWELGDKSCKLVKRWNPHDPGNIHKQAPTYARFLDSDHILTSEFPGRLVMWQVSAAKAVYRLDLTNGGVPAVSATGRYFAAPANNGLFVFEAQSGKVLGQLPGDPGVVNALSFSPNGRQLASLSSQRLMVWNLANGELYRDIYFPTAVNANNVDWLADGFVLLGGEKLVDLERRIVLWQYQYDVGGGQGYGEMGGYFWYVISNHNRQERGLFRAKLPHDEPVKIVTGLNADQLLAIKPGTQVSLNVAVQGDQQAVSQALTRQLQTLGMSVAPGSRVVLQAMTETGKSHEIQYRTIGRGRGVEKIQVTDQIARVKFIEDGKAVWEAVSIKNAPHFLRMTEGQTLQQALAPYQTPNMEFFSHVKLPQSVARPHPNGAYGASRLSFQGIQASQVTVAKPGG